MANGPTPPNVLLVEDEWLIANDLRSRLGSAGYTVIGPAGSIEDALSLIEADRIDAAFLDLDLRGTSSAPVAAALEQRGIPFAFLSGHSSVDIGEAFRSRPLFLKPVETQDLLTWLATGE